MWFELYARAGILLRLYVFVVYLDGMGIPIVGFFVPLGSQAEPDSDHDLTGGHSGHSVRMDIQDIAGDVSGISRQV